MPKRRAISAIGGCRFGVGAADVSVCPRHRVQGDIAARPHPRNKLAVVQCQFAERRLADVMCPAVRLDLCNQQRAGSVEVVGQFHRPTRLCGLIHGGQFVQRKLKPWRSRSSCGINPTVGLPDEIRRRMAALGHSTASLAAAAGVRDSFVKDIIRSKSRNPRAEQVQHRDTARPPARPAARGARTAARGSRHPR